MAVPVALSVHVIVWPEFVYPLGAVIVAVYCVNPVCIFALLFAATTETKVPAVTLLCEIAVIAVPSAVVVLLSAIVNPASVHVKATCPTVEEILPKPLLEKTA